MAHSVYVFQHNRYLNKIYIVPFFVAWTFLIARQSAEYGTFDEISGVQGQKLWCAGVHQQFLVCTDQFFA